MALVKCPRCELNYILDGDKLCTVCRKEVRGEVTEPDDMTELCSECGENPVVPGTDMCLACFKEMSRRATSVPADDTLTAEDASLEIDSVSTMDEIAIDIADDLDGGAFAEDDDEFKDDEDEEEDKDGQDAEREPDDEETLELDALEDDDDSDDDDLLDS